MKKNGRYIKVGKIGELEEGEMQQVRVGDRTVVLIHLNGEVRALDNRCPHMGFPLSQGTVKNGILTCHWHHARFDISSGCTFDLFADDVPVYETYVEDGDIHVSKNPTREPTQEYYSKRLARGLEQNIGLIQAKSIIGMLEFNSDYRSIVREIARFGGANHESWGDGMTSLAVVANLWPNLGENSRIHSLAKASRMLARNCAGMPTRRDRNALEGTTVAIDQLKQWFHHWAMVRQRDGAERTLLTAADVVGDSPGFNDLAFGTISDRIFSNQGHTLDFFNKACELLGHIGWDSAESIFPTLMPQIANARGGEEQSAWRTPIDLIEIVRAAEADLPTLLSDRSNKTVPVKEGLFEILWGDDPYAVASVLKEEISRGADILDLARYVCYAAAMRLARFPESNDINDWFDPVHTLNYANAVYQSLSRSISVDTVKGLYHAALSVYKDRFLNIPEAKLPHERNGFKDLPDDPDALLENLLELLNHRQNLTAVTSSVARYVRLDHPRERLIDSLAFATLREDVDFHKIQILEAGVRQAELWRGRVEEEHIYVGVARHLAAHCPTRRAESRMTDIAIRLHRGEAIYEEDG